MLICGGSEQGEVSAVKVPHILEARGEEVCSGELGPDAGAAAHNQVLVIGIERRDLLYKVGILLLPMWSDGEVVGNISSTGDMALVKVLPHPDIEVLVRGRAEEGACLVRVHHRDRCCFLHASSSSSQGAHVRVDLSVSLSCVFGYPS